MSAKKQYLCSEFTQKLAAKWNIYLLVNLLRNMV